MAATGRSARHNVTTSSQRRGASPLALPCTSGKRGSRTRATVQPTDIATAIAAARNATLIEGAVCPGCATFDQPPQASRIGAQAPAKAPSPIKTVCMA
ncbi:Uncharacterised protein [Sphingomonas paucimobilis]|nr:Uncharacterised protein [Sphingomonas paucimobilis]